MGRSQGDLGNGLLPLPVPFPQLPSSSSSTNVLGMELSFTETYTAIERIPEQTNMRKIPLTVRVTKIKRSKEGFRNPAGMVRPCRRCKKEDQGRVSGREPWPAGTWQLEGKVDVEGDERRVLVVLCTDHFKELREEAKRGRNREWSDPNKRVTHIGVGISREPEQWATYHQDPHTPRA